jgi:Glycoside-hydrolase family GH114
VRGRTGALGLIVACVKLVAAAAALAAGPTPHGNLTLTGTLQDGSTVTASGVTWTPAPGSYQSIAYSWSACASTCAPLSTPVHQPYLASATLGPGDVGKKIRVVETATDVTPDGTPSSASVTYTTSSSVEAWPAGTAPRVDFVYGLPEASTASTREQFKLSKPHANPADGTVSVSCAVDGGAYSTACANSLSYLTPVLSFGLHSVDVRASNAAGATTTSYSWRVVATQGPVACSNCFHPPHLDSTGQPMSWDWQLQGALVFRTVDMFDIDGTVNTASDVAKIHSRPGRTLPHEKAICYLSLGSWENFRPDVSSWPAQALGLALGGYPAEHWVDVRQLSSLLPVIDSRL